MADRVGCAIIKVFFLLMVFGTIMAVVPLNHHIYYAYGDSMTAPDYTYVMQMRDMYDPLATADHNTDGSGKTSLWGLDELGDHYQNGTTFFFFMFTNDQFHGMDPTQTASNYEGIYRYVKNHGSIPVPSSLHFGRTFRQTINGNIS